MLVRLARFAYRRRRLMVFGIWLPLMVALAAAGGSVGDYRTSFSLPESESKQVVDILTEAGQANRGGSTAQIVFTAPQGIADPQVKTAMEGLFAKVAELPGLAVVSPYTEQGARFVSPDPTKPIAFAAVEYEQKGQAESLELAGQIKDLGNEARAGVPGLDIQYGGMLFSEFEFPPSEILGFLAAVIILLVAFGSVLAMGLPLGTAVFGLMSGIGIVGLASTVMQMPEFSTQMSAMIGLGVGIDYALFIVTRYREYLHSGFDPEEATVRAVDTSGRAVVFAGITVMISLLGLWVVGLSFVRGLAVAGAIAVLVMMLASVSLLPALLGFAGRSVENTTRAAAIGVATWVLVSLVGVFTGALALLGVGPLLGIAVWAVGFVPGLRTWMRTLLPQRREKPRQQQFWWRWSRLVQRRPWSAFLGGSAVLVILSLPLLDLRLGFGDTGNLPEDYTARKAYDLISDGFGPGYNAPLVLVSDDPAGTPELLQAVSSAVDADPGVAFVSPPAPVADGITLWQVYPTTSAQDEATSELVQRLRAEVLPDAGVQVKVGGFNAGSVDFADYLAGRLPILIGGVLVLSFLLLMLVFRSLLVPLKAVIMNLLSVGAAYGVIVAIFQWGWGKDLIGVGKAGPVEAWAPMMLFAIVFGLSMDYEVFLLSRMKEEFERTGDNASAVADGLAVTARVITAAALIMVCVFAAFVLGVDRQLKLFGLGMAVAVLVDATVVRMVLVPATMELLGARNWWMPRWMDRVLPHLNVEGTVPPAPADAAGLDDEPELVGSR
ncbi:MAG: MMPL family transporter [Acidobacteria bacterium]|nr:MMPL family transporter [Acidobacteriota bacterium]